MKWPDGIASAGVSSGIKPGGALDLGLIVARSPCRWTGVFTTNAAAAAPVLWCKELQGRAVRALVVNSGNANACTGPAGMRTIEAAVSSVGQTVSCDPREVLVASTGPIGVPLSADPFISGVPAAARDLSSDPFSFASSILTTDTYVKTTAMAIDEATLVGVAKGAAMIAPSMATMLAFLVTDATPPEDLDDILRGAVDRTFNRISIDGCESTNDSVFLLTTGRGGPVSRNTFATAVEDSCADLANQIVHDAEGGTKVVDVVITSAADEAEAVACGRAVADSALWRCAVNGSDPNWGRVVAALGSTSVPIDLEKLTVTIGPEVLFDAGRPVGSLEVARKAMEAEEFSVGCDLGRGGARATFATVDLSADYVRLNSEIST